MKTHVIMLNSRYPKDKVYYEHGIVATNYQELIAADSKIHIIKQNYALWAKHVKEINDGRAVLSLRHLDSEKLAKDSKQVEFLRFSGIAIGVERLVYTHPNKVLINDIEVDMNLLAQNEGFNVSRFRDLYKFNSGYPMAVVHLTPFRYADCGYSDILQRYTSLRKNIAKISLENPEIHAQMQAQISYLVDRLKQSECYSRKNKFIF